MTLRSLALALSVGLAAARAGIMIPVAGDPVDIASGKVAGTEVSPTVKAYFGIPFAAPPIRENRWRAPQPVKPWAGVFNADTMRAECYQDLRAPTTNHYFGDENA